MKDRMQPKKTKEVADFFFGGEGTVDGMGDRYYNNKSLYKYTTEVRNTRIEDIDPNSFPELEQLVKKADRAVKAYWRYEDMGLFSRDEQTWRRAVKACGELAAVFGEKTCQCPEGMEAAIASALKHVKVIECSLEAQEVTVARSNLYEAMEMLRYEVEHVAGKLGIELEPEMIAPVKKPWWKALLGKIFGT